MAGLTLLPLFFIASHVPQTHLEHIQKGLFPVMYKIVFQYLVCFWTNRARKECFRKPEIILQLMQFEISTFVGYRAMCILYLKRSDTSIDNFSYLFL